MGMKVLDYRHVSWTREVWSCSTSEFQTCVPVICALVCTLINTQIWVFAILYSV